MRIARPPDGFTVISSKTGKALSLKLNFQNWNFYRWDKRDLRRWEAMREKGLGWFIWHRGVLTWGLSTGIAISCFDYFTKSNPNLLKIAANLLLFPLIGGAFYGLWDWNDNERQYRKRIGKLNKEPKRDERPHAT